MEKTIFESYGFTEPNPWLEKAIKKPEFNISGYFVGQFLATLLLGGIPYRRNLELQKKNLDAITELKEKYQKEMTEKQTDHLRSMSEQGLKYQEQLSLKSWENRKKLDEFKNFLLSVWRENYRIPFDSILKEHLETCPKVKPLKVLVARTDYFAEDPDYRYFVEQLRRGVMSQLSPIDSTYILAWQKPSKGVIPDSMNLFYAMQGLPTLIVYPRRKGHDLSMEYALWGTALGYNNMRIEKFGEIPGCNLSTPHLAEIISAIASYASDSYQSALLWQHPTCLNLLKQHLEDSSVFDFIRPHYNLLAEKLQSIGKADFSEEIIRNIS